MNEGFVLVNSAARAQKHPDTWQHPEAADVAELAKGGYFKVGVEALTENIPGERFWVRTTAIDAQAKTITGKVEQVDMVFANHHGINHNDELTVSFDEVCATLPVASMNWLDKEEIAQISNVSVN